MPSDIYDAIDSTADPELLEHLWSITKLRLKEEERRHESVNDRAGKCITYSFSVITAAGIILAFLRDLPEKAVAADSWMLVAFSVAAVVGFVVLLVLAVKAWNLSSQIVEAWEYRTWNEDDVRQVHLGTSEKLYSRFLLKAAWKLLEFNEDINDIKMRLFDKALRLLRYAVFAMACTVVIALFGSALSGDHMLSIARSHQIANEKGSGLMPQDNRQSGNQQGNQNQPAPASSPSSRPTPAPTPSEGAPSRRSLDRPTPAPTPSSGRPLREGRNPKGR